MRAIVVFHDHGSGVLSKLLKPGFKHVFCAVDDTDYWIRIDGQEGVPCVEVVAKSDYDLPAFYRENFTVIEMETSGKPIRSPMALANCVGMVKAFVNIRAPFTWTPWQLYKLLRKTNDSL